MKRFIKDNLDRIVAISAVVVMAMVIWFLNSQKFNYIYIVAVGIGLVCVIAYVLLRNRLKIESDFSIHWVDFCVLGFLFVLLAITEFIFRDNQYVKPLLYYIAISIGVGFLVLSALYATKKQDIYPILALACSIGLIHIYTEASMFPNSLFGMDAWGHMRRTMYEIPRAGSGVFLPSLDIIHLGGSFSSMHIFLNKIVDWFHVDYRVASIFILGGLQTLCNIVLVYFIGKKLFNYKIGVIAALMFANANWAISFGLWTIPNNLGVTFSLLVAYLAIKVYQDKNYWLAIPIAVTLFLSYITHIIAAIWVSGVICCLAVFPVLLDFVKNHRERIISIAKIAIIPIIIIASLAIWVKYTGMWGSLQTVSNEYTFTQQSGLTYAIGQAPEVVSQPSAIVNQATNNQTVNQTTNTPIDVYTNAYDYLAELIINSIGMFLYFGIAIIGCLFMFKYKSSSLHKTWAILGMTVLGIGFFPSIFGISVIEHRWWFLAEALLAVPLAVGIVLLSNVKKLIAVLLVVVIVFFSTIGFMANNTQRALSNHLIVTYAFTEDELKGINMAETFNPKLIGAGSYYCSYIVKDWRYTTYATRETGEVKMVAIDDNILSGNFSNCPADLIILRNSLYQEPYAFGSGAIYNINVNLVDCALKQGYYEVYANNNIHCLMRAK